MATRFSPLRDLVQSGLGLVYPPRCLVCGAIVADGGGLCGPCWAETPFVVGLACDTCGVPLPGSSDRPERCDQCLATPRPWARGRAALLYQGNGRRIVLALKHGDRQDLMKPAAGWLARAIADLSVGPEDIVAPVPLHRWRLLRRRYNQSASLARELARLTGAGFAPDLLVRRRPTRSLGGLGHEARMSELAGAIRPHRRNGPRAEGRRVILVDDVMASGATLAAAAEAALEAGARQICAAILARRAISA